MILTIRKPISFCILLLFAVCMCKPLVSRPTKYAAAHKISDTTQAVVKGYISMYDTIAPPKLFADSIKIYQTVGELLKFSSKLSYQEGQTRIAARHFIVGSDGQIQKSKIEGESDESVSDVEDIDMEMRNVMNFVLANLTKWEPACLKKDSSKKFSHLIDVAFYFYQDEILFTVRGEEYYFFLQKSYAPNYSKVIKAK